MIELILKKNLIFVFFVKKLGWTSLHEAANRGLVGVARELLRSGAKVNVIGLDGVTPLHDASVNGT